MASRRQIMIRILLLQPLLISVAMLIGDVTGQQQQYYGSAPLRSSIAIETSMPTVTVRGFLNFRTTVDGTVIVFTPSPNGASSSVATKIEPTKAPIEIDQAPQIKPTRTVTPGSYPTGLVTVLGGTVVNEGSTTVYETKVIGTYISGKYAQILSSTTKVRPNDEVHSPTVRPTPTFSVQPRPTRVVVEEPKKKPEPPQHQQHPLRVKTAKLAESSKARNHHHHHHVQNHQQQQQQQQPLNARLQLNPLKSRWAKLKQQPSGSPETGNNNGGGNGGDLEPSENKPSGSIKVRKLKIIGGARGTNGGRFTLPPRQSPRVKMNRFKSKLPPTQAEEMQQYYDTKQKEKELKEAEDAATSTPKTDTAIDDETKEKILESLTAATPVLNSSPEEISPEGTVTDGNSIDPSRVVKEVQTITSEVTQHVEGNHLQIKTLTLTTTIERTLHPTESADFDPKLIQPTLDISGNNIEATSVPETPALVISRTYSVTERTMRTTVVPVFDGTATQSHTVTESFFIRKLITAYRTLPPGDMILIDSTSVDGNDGTGGMQTLLVNGTEVDDLSMAEQTIQPSSVESNILPTEMPNFLDNHIRDENLVLPSASIEPSLILPQQSGIFPGNGQQQPLSGQFDLNNPLLLAAVLQNPQLAAVYLGLQQMKQQATQFSTVTKPTQVRQTETMYHTKVVSYYDGRQTRSRTILEPTGTTEVIIPTFTTEIVPVINPNYAIQQAQFQNMFATQFGGMMVQQPIRQTPTLPSTTVLKTITTVTDSTVTKSKVYTLVYNAFSTRYRTITSTSIVPTTVTSIITETMMMMMSSMLPPINFFG